MQWYEVRGLMKYGYYSYRSDFERTRMEITSTINLFSAKGKRYTPHQVLPFEWDDTGHDAEASTTMSEEDRIRLEKKAEQYEQYFKSNGK